LTLQVSRKPKAIPLLYFFLWPAPAYHIPLCPQNNTLSPPPPQEKNLIIKCVFWFYLQILFETFLTLRRIQRDITINVHTSSYKVPLIFATFSWNLNFLDRFSKNHQIKNIMKIPPVGAELFHADGWTDMKLIITFRNSPNAPKNILRNYGPSQRQNISLYCHHPGHPK
jgi:hypothetical protein